VIEVIKLLGSWQAVTTYFGLAFLVGFVPGASLRLILRIYPKGHPRRQELMAELYAMPRFERPFFVCEQLEMAVGEGLPARLRALWDRILEAPEDEDPFAAAFRETLLGRPPRVGGTDFTPSGHRQQHVPSMATGEVAALVAVKGSRRRGATYGGRRPPVEVPLGVGWRPR
jgi:hypothetical protein